MEKRIFIIDDEKHLREWLKRNLKKDYQVETFSSAISALDTIRKTNPDLVLLDIGLPQMNGIEALAEIKKTNRNIPVIMITAQQELNTVISAMKKGAYDYLVKPFDISRVRLSVQNALESVSLRKEVQKVHEKYLQENMPCFIGESNTIKDVMDFIGMVAQSPDTPILILGETGTGKELIASAVHFNSPNAKGPFVTLNCAAIPKDLLESELFGYEKGAFSGAGPKGKKGLIEESENGTLFLDEVGDLTLEAQAKLLRFLEGNEFYRVGGTRKRNVRTRVVSATNKDIQAMIEQGTFRRDLYFRLGVIKVDIPSLNERPDDILLLSSHFLSDFSKKFNKKLNGLSEDAQEVLLDYNFTGNVRELRNLIERGALIARGDEVTLNDLGISKSMPKEVKEPGKNFAFPPLPEEGLDLKELQQEMNDFYIREALKITKGNETQAAKLLKLNRQTLRYKKYR